MIKIQKSTKKSTYYLAERQWSTVSCNHLSSTYDSRAVRLAQYVFAVSLPLFLLFYFIFQKHTNERYGRVSVLI